jgi:hypothetical protein
LRGILQDADVVARDERRTRGARECLLGKGAHDGGRASVRCGFA